MSDAVEIWSDINPIQVFEMDLPNAKLFFSSKNHSEKWYQKLKKTESLFFTEKNALFPKSINNIL